MKSVILDSVISPDWLKYGFTGLVAIFGILMYFIIKPLTQSQENKKFWIILFVLISFILLGTGGFYVYNNDRLNNSSGKTIDSLNYKVSELQEKIKILNGTTPEIENLRLKIATNKSVLDSLLQINTDLEKSTKEQSDFITDLVSNSILESLENDWRITSNKQLFNNSIKDLDFKRLQRVVFLNFLKFNADKTILQQSLLALHKTSGEIATSDINRILSNFNNLMQLKLKWLNNSAIPAMNEAFEYIEKHPQIQSGPSATIKLPKEIWIIQSDTENDHTVTFTDIVDLKKEKRLIEQRLINSK
jgi:hypothetical protein